MRKSHVFVGSSHPELGQLICDRLNVDKGPCILKKFSNGETSIEIGVSVRDEDVYVVQSGSDSINDHIMELLIFISGCRSGSANKITAVIPSFPYAKQSKMKKHRGAITARMLANLLTMAGADHIITMDLHATQMQGFFTKPVDNLYAAPTLARWIKHHIPDYLTRAVVVSKNPGGTKRVTALADALKVNFAMIHTDRRRRKGKVGVSHSGVHTITSSPSLVGFTAAVSKQPPIVIESKPLQKKKSPPTSAHAQTKTPSGLSRQMITAADIVSDDDDTDTKEGVDPEDGDVRVVVDGANGAHKELAPQLPVNGGITKRTVGGPNMEDSFTQINEDDEEEEVRITSKQGLHVGRVVHGHIVDEDYPEEEDEGDVSEAGTDDCGNMMDSVYSLASHHGEALGGSGNVDISDDDEDEHLFNQEKLITLVGDVRDKTAIILDDMIDRPGSFVAAAEHCVVNCGARSVIIVATHGIFSDNSLEELESSNCIDQVVVTNTYPIPLEKRARYRKLTVIDISPILAECIRRNHHGESISALFEQLSTF